MLLFAAVIGNADVVTLLLNHGAHASAVKGKTPREWSGSTPTLMALLQGKSLATAGDAMLGQAAEDGKTELVRLLLDARADVNSIAEVRTPLMRSIQHPETAKVLISRGANVNARSRSGNTALFEAAFGLCVYQSGSPDIIDVLLAAGADVSIPNEAGVTAIGICASPRMPSTISAQVNQRLKEAASRQKH